MLYSVYSSIQLYLPNIGFFLFQLGKPISDEKIYDWSSHVVRHFWYCAGECKTKESTSDAEALKLMKVFFITLTAYNTILLFYLVLLANNISNQLLLQTYRTCGYDYYAMCAISMIGLVGNVRMLEKTMMTTFLGLVSEIMDRRELQLLLEFQLLHDIKA